MGGFPTAALLPTMMQVGSGLGSDTELTDSEKAPLNQQYSTRAQMSVPFSEI